MRTMREHPTLWIQGSTSASLEGKTIVLAVTGSIAAVRTVELARELIRRGADVYTVMSEAASWILNPMALHYATGHEVITRLTGAVEHVEFCGMSGKANLLLIAPATANTIGKIASGVDDTPVTTFATTAIGTGIPVIIVPAMHEAMYDHPALVENLEKIKCWGIEFIGPDIREGIAKIASNEEIVLRVERLSGSGELSGRKILITSGSTAEAIDPIRILTNRSSGKTGVELALEAYRRGADVTIVHRNKVGVAGIKEIYAESASQMTETVLEELNCGYDVLISAAAIADYTLDPADTKIKSGGELTLHMRPTAKLVSKAREKYPNLFIAGFKAETGACLEELLKRAIHTLKTSKLDLIVANDVKSGGIGTEDNEVYILTAEETDHIHIKGSKRVIASALLDEMIHHLMSRK
ncbi:MAG: bifunctional phosphopantothenoylcysteine decarboxylase/phosphopantothenate--cysteine ligase CoaBC [Methanomethylovorans sp.]|uniref:bifunctional phosphopantothenoylcysteine decarboxylase/phosphopantothenate--cysteine ligase CoaBC n=1 Tax=Methanomethylovorans sp. TaxID=2758717 RepID=UPI003C791974